MFWRVGPLVIDIFKSVYDWQRILNVNIKSAAYFQKFKNSIFFLMSPLFLPPFYLTVLGPE